MVEWIRRRKGAAGSIRLFCFAQAGGGASNFARWQREAPAEVEICGVQLPGREDRIREPLPADLKDLVAVLAREVSRYFDKPYALYGHSFGARLSFELTRFLRSASLPGPEHLFISGAAAPDAAPKIRLAHLSDQEFLANVALWYQGIPAAVMAEPELMGALLPALKADFALLESMEYRPEPPLDLPIGAFGGRSDHLVSQQDMEEWARHTSRRFRLEMLEGDHFLLRTSGEAVLRSITRELQFTICASF